MPSKTLVNRTRMKVVNIALTKVMKKFPRHCTLIGRHPEEPRILRGVSKDGRMRVWRILRGSP
jgi:hypothetical protein